jgi:hypothetical protein
LQGGDGGLGVGQGLLGALPGLSFPGQLPLSVACDAACRHALDGHLSVPGEARPALGPGLGGHGRTGWPALADRCLGAQSAERQAHPLFDANVIGFVVITPKWRVGVRHRFVVFRCRPDWRRAAQFHATWAMLRCTKSNLLSRLNAIGLACSMTSRVTLQLIATFRNEFYQAVSHCM